MPTAVARTTLSPVRQLTLLSRVTAIVGSAIGCVVLIGWVLDAGAKMSLLASRGSMKPNTAICFVLAGTALWLWHAATSRSARGRRATIAYHVSATLAVVVALVGALDLLEYLFGWNVGIDQLIFPDHAGAAHARLSPATALSFVVFGASLACSMLAGNFAASIAQWGASAVMTT